MQIKSNPKEAFCITFDLHQTINCHHILSGSLSRFGFICFYLIDVIFNADNSASGCQWQRQQLEADSPASSAVSLEIIIGGSIGAFIIGLILGATVIVVCHQRGDNPEHLKRYTLFLFKIDD